MIETILAIVAGLIVALPKILTLIEARQVKRNAAFDARVKEDIEASRRQLGIGGGADRVPPKRT